MKTMAAVLAATTLWLPLYAAGGAHADCSSPSDTCTNSEMRYLQTLQGDGFDVSGVKANGWLQMGNVACADLAGGARITDELNKVWRAGSGTYTQTQAMQIVGTARGMLCPR